MEGRFPYLILTLGGRGKGARWPHLGVTTCGKKDALSWEGWVRVDVDEQKFPAPEIAPR